MPAWKCGINIKQKLDEGEEKNFAKAKFFTRSTIFGIFTYISQSCRMVAMV